MINWLRKKLGIIDVEKGVVCLHQDMNTAFNRLDAIEGKPSKEPRKGKSQRYDEIERDRKRRRKS